MKVWTTAASLLLAVATLAHGTIFAEAKSQCPARSDACINDKNLEFCQRLEKNGCRQINRSKSCPIRFFCAKVPTAPTRPVAAPVRLGAPVHRVPTTPRACPARSDPCINDDNLATCHALVQAGCQQPSMSKSCPAQFFCGNITVPKDPCPSRNDKCINDDNLATCQALVRAGCQQPFMSKSCPVQFSCGNITVPKDPCPPRNDECMTKDLYARCQDLAQQGCTSIIAALSCPYAGFGCAHELPPMP